MVSAKRVVDIKGVLFKDILDTHDLTPASSTSNQSLLNDQIARESIDLMVDLFLSPNALTVKNKQQLLKHFESYSNVDSTKEQVHSGRLLKIAVFCLKLAKESHNRTTDE